MRTPLLVFLLFIATHASAQFQLGWMYERGYVSGYGLPFSSYADQQGGLFLASQTEDSVCNYAMAEIIHLSSTGNIAWEKPVFYEAPCLQQDLYYYGVAGTSMYYAFVDTASWLVKSDTSGVESWMLDTNSLVVIGDIDRYENITGFNFGPNVVCFDSSGQHLWSYGDPYPYTHQIRRVITDGNGNRNVFLEFNDGSQAETRGVGIFQLDSNGVFQWDTIINPQTNPDVDLLEDVKLDNMNNSYVLAYDMWQFGCYLTKIDEDGNIVATNQFTPTPVFRPSQLEIDTIHGIVYIAGRTSDYLMVLKYDLQLNALDTMLFDRNLPDINVIGVNEYGYLYHSWVSDSTGDFELRVDLYNHLGQLLDVYTYWDSTRFSTINPYEIVFDSIGDVFLVCNARGFSFNDICLVFKFTNPLNILESSVSDNNLVVFPNPADGMVAVSLTNNVQGESYTVYNSTGQSVLQNTFSGNTCTIDTQVLTRGIYFIEVVTQSGIRSTQKLIIQRP